LLQSKDAGIRTLVMLDEQGGQSQITLLSACRVGLHHKFTYHELFINVSDNNSIHETSKCIYVLFVSATILVNKVEYIKG